MRHGIVVCAFVLAAGLLLSGDLRAGNLEPPGPPAPTMKTLSQVEARTPISSLPFTIAAPGSYYLTGNLTGVSGQVGINITSSFVTIDLNGFSLIGVGGSIDGIRAMVVGTKHIVIRNGVIRNWGQGGITADNAAQVHARDLQLDANGGGGLLVGPRSIVRDTTSTGNTGHGIAAGTGSTIIGCTASNNTQWGITAGQNSVVSSSTATSNVIGIALILGGSMITDCNAQQNTIFGFFLEASGNRVFHSVARSNATGIFGGDGVSVEECSVDFNTDDGIRIGHQGLARGNYVRLSTNDGIHVTGSDGRIEDNEVIGSSSAGIRVDGVRNLIAKNLLNGNTLGYQIGGGNKFGPVSADPATAGPWANF